MKIIRRLVLCLIAAFLAACNAPAIPVSTPDSAGLATTAATAIPLTEILPLPTEILPTTTSFPTETSLSGKPVVIAQIHMLDETNGWGGVAKPDGSFELLRSADGGQTWANATPHGKSVSSYGGFFLDGQTAWVPFSDPTNNASSLLHTTDGGKTWISLSTIESAENATYAFSNLKDGVAQTAGVGAGNLYLNLYQTHDGGETWAPIPITPPAPETGLPGGTIHLCNICGDGLYYNPARIIITYGDLANDPAGTVRLAISTDLGLNWKNLKLPLPDQKYSNGLTAPQIPTFFGSDGILPVNIINYKQDGSLAYSVLIFYVTQDGGQSWVIAPGLLEDKVALYQSVLILSPKDIIVRCGGNLCSSNDGAQTWRTLPANLDFDSALGGPDYVSQFTFINAKTGWAISGEGDTAKLWKTSDGGTSWTMLAPKLVP